MDKTKWIIFAVVAAVVFGAIIWFSKSDQPPAFTGDASKIINEGPIADRTYGSTEQKVVLIEYGDYQCPACASVEPTVSALKEQYKDRLTFVFRNFPLTNIHPNALAASTAAEAAGQQGKFWEMHDLLYETQQAWSNVSADQRTGVFEDYATQLGLDVEKFKQDIASQDVSSKISRDRDIAQQVGVDQTPTFVLNGQKVDQALVGDPAAFSKLVEDAIKQAYPEEVNNQSEPQAQ